ncbi:MAG: PAS domain-containing protein [Deltaproteobacteria bacterium]|nr:MAG: PAS domain-containing protein [Deltaproteobacteria bacterium]
MDRSNFPRIPFTDLDLLESEEFQLRIFESFADPLAVYDRSYQILKVNQPLLKFYQRSAGQLLGRHCYQVFHGRSAVCENCHVEKVFETGKPQRREMLITLPDGSRRFFVVHAYPVKDDGGAVIQALEHGRDVTYQKTVEKELRSAKQFRENIINAITDTLLVIDPHNFRIMQANNSFLSRVGLDAARVLGRTCYEILLRREHPCAVDGLDCPVEKSAKIKRTAMVDKVYPDARGVERVLHIASYPLLDSQGEVELVVRLERDVTEKRTMEEALAFRSRELQKTQHQLETLFEISRQMNAKDSLVEIIESLKTITEEIFPHTSSLFLIMDAGRTHFLRFGEGLGYFIEKPGLVADFIRFLGILQESCIITGRDSPARLAFLKTISGIFPQWLGIPIMVERQCIGFFLLSSQNLIDYSNRDLQFIQALLDQTSGHIRSLVLHESKIRQVHSRTAKVCHGEIIGQSKRMQEVYELIDLVAGSDATVLITGENGTGKELVAQAIHRQSHRRKGPFVVANCSAYSPTLLESELFGHEKGAFTGAIRQKKGRIERAHGGTLFLDEIDDISPATQVLLLRFLQDHYFERVGGERAIEANVRVLAATNQDLQKGVDTGKFRNDLYYRLNVIAIHLPALRERKDDIPLLCRHFLSKCSAKEKKNIQKFSANAMQTLMDYDWPGNVRQLENAVNHAVIVAQDDILGKRHLPRFLKEIEDEPASTSLTENERRLILRVLQETNWNKHDAARRLEVTRSTLYSKIRRYGLERAGSA